MFKIIDLILSGGVIVYPLLLCAFLGIIVSLERLVYWSYLKASYSTFDVERVYTLMAHKQFDEVKEILESSDDPSLICLKHCLASKGRIHSQILQSLAQQKLDRAKKFMRLLETITTVSPLLGILGTVTGIITSMNSGDVGKKVFDSQIMMAGLSEALVCTALGLVIAIAGTIIYGHFAAEHDFLKSKLERDLSAFESLVSNT